MNIVSRKLLNDFATLHSVAKKPLDAWFKVASTSAWSNFSEIRKTFPNADLVGRLIVFNIGGNKYRLIAKITYSIQATSGTVYIRNILTHAAYDKEEWKNDPWF